LSVGDHADAHRKLCVLVDRHRTGGVTEPGAMRFIPDDIEALTNLGMTQEAEELLNWYAGTARETGRVSAMAAAGRCRGMLLAAAGEIDAAVASLESAAAQQTALGMPFEHGRTQLILGTTLRRGLRRAAARHALEQARATFTKLGAAAWAGRTNLELERIGGRARAIDTLTPSEDRVAHLVAQGLSNREAAAAAFVTVKTVEVTLTRVYRKLGLRSRTELVRSFSGQDPRTDRSV
jgi:DNA-binding CsgD family transcriptional regulator